MGNKTTKGQQKVEAPVRARSHREVKQRSGYGKAWDFHLPKALRSVAGLRKLREEAEQELSKRPRRGGDDTEPVIGLSGMVH